MSRLLPIIGWLGGTLALCHCDAPDPQAGQITEKNAEELLLRGATAHGAVGDYFLRNENIIAIVQRPGRTFGVGPYGGNIIDIADTGTRQDIFGEAIPFLQFGLTADFEVVRVISDGLGGEPAILEAEGEDNLWDFLNLPSIAPELLSYQENERGDPISIVKFNPTADLPVRIRARYTLHPDATTVKVRYFVRNISKESIDVRVGFATDVRGVAEPFSPGGGFTNPGGDLRELGGEILTNNVDSPYLGFMSDHYSLGIKSVDFPKRGPVPRLSVGVIGVGVVLLGAENLIEVLEHDNALEVKPQQEEEFGFDLHLAPTLADVHRWAMNDGSLGTITGQVIDANGFGVDGARVAASDPATGDVLAATQADHDGVFSLHVAAGTVHLAGDHLSFPADPGSPVTVSASQASNATIVLGQTATVGFDIQVLDGLTQAQPSPTPCRFLLMGEAPARTGGVCGTTQSCNNKPFRHDKRFGELTTPHPYMRYDQDCVALGTEALTVVPGKYLAVVSRGPEFDFVKTLVDVSAGQTQTVTGTIKRAVDSVGLAVSEFHVHMVHSTDSIVPFEQRIRGAAASAVDFFVPTDHDAITDLRQLIIDMGMQTFTRTTPGSEVSTIDLGHFNAFPLEPVAGAAAGAPVDWGGARARPSPGQLFEQMWQRGAQVVQVNHARNSLSYFLRVDPQYDFANGIIEGNPETTLDKGLMFMPASAPLWSANFNAMEVYNTSSQNDAEGLIRDWFNLLSMGLKVTATATSDSHGPFRRNIGDPRTYVVVSNDSPALLDPVELGDNVAKGHAFGSSGPILRVTARSGNNTASYGDVLRAQGDVELSIRVETPAWYGVSGWELYSNQTFEHPGVDDPQDPDYEPLVPNLNRTLAPVQTTQPNGALANIFEDTVTLTSSEIGTTDAWIVIRVRGVGYSQYPVTLNGNVTFDQGATTAEGFATLGGGDEPFALGNPVYIDRDGNGVFDAPYPYRGDP